MSRFHTFFSKNNTLISGNYSNNGQNPVTEISYGGINVQLSRYIFDVDFSLLLDRIDDGFINPDRIVSHTLHMTNTISNADEYVGKKSYSSQIERASSFTLDLFNIAEDWDEGSGYDFIYDDTLLSDVNYAASNWYERKTDTNWLEYGAYSSGTSEIIGTQNFDKGNENLSIDVTDYVNYRLFGSGYTETVVITGSTYGLGVKFTDSIEELETELKQAVAFYGKYTNTWYEPYIETIIDDTITDDRNYFYLDKDNDLYLYAKVGGIPQNITVNYVNIYDNNDTLIETLSGDSIINVSKGVYKITLNLDSDTYSDAVLFTDEWNVTINNKVSEYSDEFYLISQDKYYSFNQSNSFNFNNYYFYFWGINEGENITAGVIKNIKLTVKEMYPSQNSFIPLDIEYRLYTTIAKKYEIDVIPFTAVNRTNNGYEFNLDTSWLIPQDYCLQIRMKNGNYYDTKETLSFTVTSNGLELS